MAPELDTHGLVLPPTLLFLVASGTIVRALKVCVPCVPVLELLAGAPLLDVAAIGVLVDDYPLNTADV